MAVLKKSDKDLPPDALRKEEDKNTQKVKNNVFKKKEKKIQNNVQIYDGPCLLLHLENKRRTCIVFCCVNHSNKKTFLSL